MRSNIALILAAAAGGLLLVDPAFAAASQHESIQARPNTQSATANAGKNAPSRIAPLDINSASKAELMKLPGLDAAAAQGVIARRPYQTKAQLVTRQVISQAQYEAIRSSIFARQPGGPGPAITGRK